MQITMSNVQERAFVAPLRSNEIAEDIVNRKEITSVQPVPLTGLNSITAVPPVTSKTVFRP